MKSILDRVTVGFRCPMDWEEMAGSKGERFCSQCRKSVVVLSEMTTAEAEDVVREKGGEGAACVRLMRDQEGKLVTKGCRSSQENAQTILRKAAVGVAVAGGLSVAACAKQEPYPTMGVICIPGEK